MAPCVPTHQLTRLAYKVAACVQALNLYRQLLAGEDADPLFNTYAAACLYYMGLYDQAEVAANEVLLRVNPDE